MFCRRVLQSDRSWPIDRSSPVPSSLVRNQNELSPWLIPDRAARVVNLRAALSALLPPLSLAVRHRERPVQVPGCSFPKSRSRVQPLRLDAREFFRRGPPCWPESNESLPERVCRVREPDGPSVRV